MSELAALRMWDGRAEKKMGEEKKKKEERAEELLDYHGARTDRTG
jgi:hypothetical protein